MSRGILLLFAFVVLSLSACSKEKQLEKALHKQGGSWNIDRIEIGLTFNGTFLGDADDRDAGTVDFNRGGSGSYNYDYSLSYKFGLFTIPVDVNTSGNFNWTVNESSVTVPNGDGSIQIWEVEDISNNQQVWTSTYTNSDSVNTVDYAVRKEVTRQ